MFTLVEAAGGLGEAGMMLRLNHVTFADNRRLILGLFLLDLGVVGHWFDDSNGARFLRTGLDAFNDLTGKSFFDALTRNCKKTIFLIIVVCTILFTMRRPSYFLQRPQGHSTFYFLHVIQSACITTAQGVYRPMCVQKKGVYGIF